MNYNEFVLELTKKMITFETVNPPGNELELAKYLNDLLKEMGMDSYLEEVDENRANVIARIGTRDGKKLVLNGHLDVVPVGSGWTQDPFKPYVSEGKLYGRGSSDMKGGIASMITAAKILIGEKFDFENGELILAFVVDEELVNKGTRRFLKNGDKIDYAIIGEPTDLDICVGHKGTIRYNITTLGKACHSSSPDLGINSVYKIAKLILEFEKYHQSLQSKKHKYLGAPSFAVTVINGGEKDNIIPENCQIQVDRRILPGESVEDIEKEIMDILNKLAEEDNEFKYTIEKYICLLAAEVSDESDLVNICKKTYKDLFDNEVTIKGFTASCEQQLFLANGIETLVYGPGSIKQAHIIDEFIEVEQLYKASDFYASVVKDILR
jgi:acetylornithine deacetylase/succinyl-diaminopimelate desuccinylase family protein